MNALKRYKIQHRIITSVKDPGNPQWMRFFEQMKHDAALVEEWYHLLFGHDPKGGTYVVNTRKSS